MKTYVRVISPTKVRVIPHSPILNDNRAPEKAPISMANICQTPYLNGGKSYLPQSVEIHTQSNNAPYPPQNNAPHSENHMTKNINPGAHSPKEYSYQRENSSRTSVMYSSGEISILTRIAPCGGMANHIFQRLFLGKNTKHKTD